MTALTAESSSSRNVADFSTPPVPPASSTAQIAMTASDVFLRRFLNVWVLAGGAALALLVTRFPIGRSVSFSLIFVTGVIACGAMHLGWLRLGRFLTIAPVAVFPIFLSFTFAGVQTPALILVAPVVVLTGWIMGRRTMLAVSGFFMLCVLALWVFEIQGGFASGMPQQIPAVWAIVWVFAIAMIAVLVWYLLEQYESVLARQVEINRALESATKFNETILFNSPLAMGVYAADGRCVMANDAFAQLVGETTEAILAQNFNDIESWKTSGLRDICNHALERHTPGRIDSHVVTSFGKEIWVECRALPTVIYGERHLLVQFVDLTERKLLEQELRQLAFADTLTKLPNRRLFMDRLAQAVRNAKRQRSYGALLFLDLNKFKQLNDHHGHDAGDMLLVEVANRLRGVVRESDTVARLGGDEFIILLEGLGTDVEVAAELARKVRDTVYSSLSDEYVLGDIRHNGSASIGISVFGGDEREPEQILQAADQAMYAAKRAHAC